ncbi:MAG TPA: HAD family phosphatase [Terriglobia bacterium]|nr:HAD family phosphatase [Terriglobia bacterium]
MPSATPPAAAIFDMDGVLVNSNPVHVTKWIDYLKERNVPFVAEEVPQKILGLHNDDVFRAYFGDSMSPDDIRQAGEELEARFREVFRPQARPLPGVVALLNELQSAGIPMAVASSGIRSNVEFMVDVLDIRSFFQFLITGDDVRAHKPDPEIYLKAAVSLGAEPSQCVAFEDSFAGIGAVKNAGMKCVAIASTFLSDELRRRTQADLIVPGFEELSLETLRSLFIHAESPVRD